MSSGFNTDISHQDRSFHIQTEDRGLAYLVIDTAVYQNGRVLFRKSLNYKEFTIQPEFTAQWLRARVEEHHRTVIEDLRAGLFDVEIGEAIERNGRESGIQVQLLNPQSWLAAGSVSLDVQVLREGDGQPQPDAEVKATIEGALEEVRHVGHSDGQGRARLRFPLPALGKGELALVISARADGRPNEIRFTIRSREKASAPPAAPKA
jgi:hypothetical protein